VHPNIWSSHLERMLPPRNLASLSAATQSASRTPFGNAGRTLTAAAKARILADLKAIVEDALTLIIVYTRHKIGVVENWGYAPTTPIFGFHTVMHPHAPPTLEKRQGAVRVVVTFQDNQVLQACICVRTKRAVTIAMNLQSVYAPSLPTAWKRALDGALDAAKARTATHRLATFKDCVILCVHMLRVPRAEARAALFDLVRSNADPDVDIISHGAHFQYVDTRSKVFCVCLDVGAGRARIQERGRPKSLDLEFTSHRVLKAEHVSSPYRKLVDAVMHA